MGPAIFSRVVSYSMNVITQAFEFVGHLGEVELAAISIANTVIVGFNFGLLVTDRRISLWVFVFVFVFV
jgi:MATE family multidrug resistance protein